MIINCDTNVIIGTVYRPHPTDIKKLNEAQWKHVTSTGKNSDIDPTSYIKKDYGNSLYLRPVEGNKLQNIIRDLRNTSPGERFTNNPPS